MTVHPYFSARQQAFAPVPQPISSILVSPVIGHSARVVVAEFLDLLDAQLVGHPNLLPLRIHKIQLTINE
jgi:hypothetical protein